MLFRSGFLISTRRTGTRGKTAQVIPRRKGLEPETPTEGAVHTHSGRGQSSQRSALGALPWGVCRFHVKPMPRMCLFSSSLFQGSTVAREASDKEKVSAWRLSPWSSAWGPAPLSSVFSSSLWFLFPLSYGGKLFVDLRNTLLQFSPSGYLHPQKSPKNHKLSYPPQ